MKRIVCFIIVMVNVLVTSCSNMPKSDGESKGHFEKLPDDKFVRVLAFVSDGVGLLCYDKVQRIGDTVIVMRYDEHFQDSREMVFVIKDNALCEVKDDGSNILFKNSEPIKIVLPKSQNENSTVNPLLYLPGKHNVERCSKYLNKDSSTYDMGGVVYDCFTYDYYKMKDDQSGDSIQYSYVMFNDKIGFCYQVVPGLWGSDLEITLQEILTFKEFDKLKSEAEDKKDTN